MRHSSLYLWSLAGMASALMSMNATAGDFLVDVRSVDPTIIVELRYAERNNLLGQPLKKVMTRRPICICEEALAVEALKVFNEHNIDDLIVVNAKHEPVGLVDSQDLPKFKLM